FQRGGIDLGGARQADRALLHLAAGSLDVDGQALAVAEELASGHPDVADEPASARPDEVREQVALLDHGDEPRVVAPKQDEVGDAARLDRADAVEPERSG